MASEREQQGARGGLAVLLWIATGVAAAVCFAALGPAATAAGLLAVLVWFSVPGILVARGLYGGWGTALMVGAGWGYALSSLGLLAVWAAGARHLWWFLLAPLPGLLLAWPARRLRGLLAAPILSRADAAAVTLVLLAVFVIAGRPFARVGADLPDGRAYRAYFTADFVSNMGIVAELSKGDMPPKNPYFAGDSLHYYWLMHLLPAAERRSGFRSASIEQLLLTTALWAALAFAAFFYWFVRHFVTSAGGAAAGCLFLLFCSSFEGIERIWAFGGALEPLRFLNIDAIGNWVYQGMKVDGLHRAVLYQPQHELGYLLGLSALLLIVQARDASRVPLLLAGGVLLALSMLFSSFAALMLAIVVAAYEAWRLAAARRWAAFLPCALAAAVPMAGALAVANALGYVDTAGTGNPMVRVGVNRLATRALGANLLLDFGPVLIVGAIGFAAILRRRAAAKFAPLWLLFAICMLFYFLVDVPDHDSVYVAWRASHLAFLGAGAVVAFGFQEWWAPRSRGGIAMLTVAVIVAALAVPTVAIDVYNTQDVSNRAEGPGFRWTVVLSPGELEALAWIKASTTPQARVQVEPIVRRRETWAYMPAWGERRMAGGLPLGMIPLAKYEAVSEKVQTVYASASAREAWDRASALCIDYLVVGEPERAGYPALPKLLDADPDLFPPAFRNDAITVYAVRGSFSREECAK